MQCPECNNEISGNAICCDNCKDKLKRQLSNLRTYCSANSVVYVLIAYGLIKGHPLFEQAVNLYGDSVCGQGHFNTVAQLYRFILDALDDYDANHNNWDEFLSFYQKNGCYLIDYVEKKL